MKSKKYPLKVEKEPDGYRFPVAKLRSSLPYIKGKRGQLWHRPRVMSVRKTLLEYERVAKPTYITVNFHCNNSSNGDEYNLASTLPEGAVLCQRCEEMAVEAGLPSSQEIHQGVETRFKVGKVCDLKCCC